MSAAKCICQYEDGPSTFVVPVDGDVTMSSWELEDIINSHVSTNAEVPINIQLRFDPHLVDARRPGVPIETVTGIWEDSLCNPDVHVSLWQVTDASFETKCACTAPHSEWTRQPMSSNNNNNGDVDIMKEQPVHVEWVDLRSTEQLRLETPAACCHFLRSLLGSSHAKSPWRRNDETQDLPNVVAVLLPCSASSALGEFRTGDACPSYFLHSITQLQVPTSTSWFVPREESTQDDDKAMKDATLFVYKTMPPRDRLTRHHPDNITEKLPDGCLWETYQKHHVGDDDEIKDDPPEQEDEEEHYRQVGPPYVSHKQDYANLLDPLIKHMAAIRDEALSIPQWTAWPERNHYRSNGDGASWTVFPLCHCFPAHVVENRKWIDVTCAHVPQTVKLLKEALGDTLRTALFSRLDPETTLEAHTGWQDLANRVIRVHIPLVVPEGGLCGTWVDGCVETHEEGRPLCFDDAKVHRAFNYSKQDRIVLILDLARPDYLPVGTATGGHTEELDDFIASLT